MAIVAGLGRSAVDVVPMNDMYVGPDHQAAEVG